uniref:SLC41A/MgtE integral membrane domain-containing protein n=1 Tax=Strongyloides stercoralis TaxID=6248 RepID=A0AAF5DQT8_STRER
MFEKKSDSSKLRQRKLKVYENFMASFENPNFTNDNNNISNDEKNVDNVDSSIKMCQINSNSVFDDDISYMVDNHNNEKQSSYVFLAQVIFPFIIAGLGMVFAGTLLDVVQHWSLFKSVPEIFILVPALLGLKGNLEMTLASRLSTLANTGKIDDKEKKDKILLANVALIQTQAIVVAFLASTIAIVLAWISNGTVDWAHACLLCASSLTTASFASIVLSVIMIIVILTAKKFNIDPDNIATPIAASLGDLITLTILSCFGSFYLKAHETESWLNLIVIILFICFAPFCAFVAYNEDTTVQVLCHGWTPIILSMFISSAGGFVLEKAIKKFPQTAVFQPVINGVGGNLAAVHASRISTFYHKSHSALGILPYSYNVRKFLSINRAFFSNDWDAKVARVLLFLVVPGHIFFNWVIKILQFGSANATNSSLFTTFYLLAALLQVFIILYISQLLIAFLWSEAIDPDNAAIPYLTAFGDLTGTLLLYIAFEMLALINDKAIIIIKN